MKFKGIVTALITPFYQGELDKKSFIRLIKHQLDEGVDGFVLNGTTGEAPTLEEKEVSQLVEWAKVEVAGHVPLILGVGHNSTKQAQRNIRRAYQLKVDGVLAVVPYYNKPSQEGLLRHFKKLSEESFLPIILYNVPGRTQVSLDISTIIKLSKEKFIQGLKEASGDMAFGEKLFSSNLPSHFVVTSGDDATFLNLAQKGGEGVISVSSHFILKSMKVFLNRIFNKEASAIADFQQKYGDVIDLLFKVSNPMMVKQVMYLSKMIRSPELRLPLCEPDVHLVEKMKNLLKEKGILET